LRDDVDEEHGDLLVLRAGITVLDGCAAAVTKPGVL
jgi:hypothetical protein